jgi:ADP-dependent NAD(P)H-hydrate dehydratase / NAD(P)H-hydrate epimerase
MRSAHAVPTVRAAEQALMAEVPAGTLMQRAAAGLAAACLDVLDNVYGARVVVLAGGGDNAGDALFAGARLARRGASVTVVQAGSRLHEGGAAALASAGGRVVRPEPDQGGNVGAANSADPASSSAIASAARPGTSAQPATGSRPWPAAERAILAADLIIDGLTGIGGQGGLREPAATLAGMAAQARDEGALVVAVDLPSGVDAGTGEVHGPAIAADVTVTFGTWKPGLLIDPGASLTGAAQLVDIGLGPYLGEPAALAMQAQDVAAVLPEPAAESDKYRRGVLGVLAGSDQYTGAAVLSVGAAIHGGAGMVRLVSAGPALQAVRQHWPEAVLTDAGQRDASAAAVIESAGRVQAWVAGPGMGTGPEAVSRLAAVLATNLPVLVDADGITIVAANPELLRRSAPTLITPHAGELARLTGADRADIEARRLHHASAAAAQLGVTVLLKGSTTVIAQPGAGQPVFVNATGTSWLATAGSGDVLSGLTGALLAQGADTVRAAAAAAYLHGLAGRLAADGAPIGASDIITSLASAIRTVTTAP